MNGRRTSTDTVQLTVLPAACGDCLVIEYGPATARRRLLIDGGLSSVYETGLGSFLAGAGAPARCDLAVVTHVDRDHIDGMIRALADDHLDADEIWFNGRDEIDALVDAGGRGVRQGDELSRLIPAEKRNRIADHRAIHVPDSGPTSHQVAGATVTLLAPVKARLERLLRRWPEPPDEVPTDATEALLAAFEDPGTRGEGEFGEDSSAANGSSIAFLLEVSGVALLLTGDAFAGDLAASIRQLLTARGEAKLRVDLFKLSHHGSRQNMTDELLDLIEPGAVLVCTDGSKFKHPDEDAMRKVREHYPDVPIHFSDDDGVNEHIRRRAAIVGSQPIVELPLRLRFPIAD